MPRQLDLGGSSSATEALDEASRSSNTEDNGWEPALNKRKPRQQRELNVQPVRPPMREKMLWRQGMILGIGGPLHPSARVSLTAFRGAGGISG